MSCIIIFICNHFYAVMLLSYLVVPGPVSNLTFTVSSSTVVKVLWEEPKNPNGMIVRYSVIYKVIDGNRSWSISTSRSKVAILHRLGQYHSHMTKLHYLNSSLYSLVYLYCLMNFVFPGASRERDTLCSYSKSTYKCRSRRECIHYCFQWGIRYVREPL